MGIIRAEFSFANPAERALQPIKAQALVDTGALHLCLPEHMAIQLNLRELEQREVTLANGHRTTVPYCGPVEICFKNRHCFTGAVVMGDEPLLGAIPMEDMDLVVIPSRQTVDVNPLSPNIPLSVAKPETHGRQASEVVTNRTQDQGRGSWYVARCSARSARSAR